MFARYPQPFNSPLIRLDIPSVNANFRTSFVYPHQMRHVKRIVETTFDRPKHAYYLHGRWERRRVKTTALAGNRITERIGEATTAMAGGLEGRRSRDTVSIRIGSMARIT